MSSNLAILGSGMITGVGLSAPASCAAIRLGINGFVETRFMFAGEWLVGCPVPLEEGWRGEEKLLRMVLPAIEECLQGLGSFPLHEIPLLLCVAERERPGRFAGLGSGFLERVQERLGKRFHSESVLIEKGRVGGLEAIDRARSLIARGSRYCVVAGVDTFLVASTLVDLEDQRRLKTEDNSDGLIPGEAGAALLLASSDRCSSDCLECLGFGYGSEPALMNSGQPLRAEGLVQAIREAMQDGGVAWGDLDYRITDLSGSQYGFKEAALALTRMLRERKEKFDIWHPADCVGEVGAAAAPCILGVALAAAQKNYAPGPGTLCHFAADGSERAAIVLRYLRETA